MQMLIKKKVVVLTVAKLIRSTNSLSVCLSICLTWTQQYTINYVNNVTPLHKWDISRKDNESLLLMLQWPSMKRLKFSISIFFSTLMITPSAAMMTQAIGGKPQKQVFQGENKINEMDFLTVSFSRWLYISIHSLSMILIYRCWLWFCWGFLFRGLYSLLSLFLVFIRQIMGSESHGELWNPVWV